MGVQHLQSHSAAAARANGSIKALNTAAGARPMPGSKMPVNGKVNAYSHVALHAAGKTATQHPKGGARVGTKTSQPKLGKSMSGILGKVHVQPSGGRAR